MAYDYSSDSKTFDVPNPYQLQNRMVFVAAAVMLLAGCYCLWQTRLLMQTGLSLHLIAPLLSSIGMLLGGLWLSAYAAKRLRFFFGRGRPQSLAPELSNGIYGSSADADKLKETIRQGALTYPEPQGALNGFLYNQIPHLITAPRALQFQARVHFFNFVSLLATFLSFIFAWGVFGDTVTRPWVSVVYGLFGVFFLLRPVTRHRPAALGTARLMFLILAAVLAPVVLGLVGAQLPDIKGLSMHAQVFALLLGALVVVCLAFLATLGQVEAPPQTRTSFSLERVNMQGPPSAVVDEIERVMQNEWTERIPNRRYSRLEPKTPLHEKSGSFHGDVLEETQPLPTAKMAIPTFKMALSSAMHRWLVISDGIALVLLCSCAVFTIVFMNGFDPKTLLTSHVINHLGTAIIFALVAGFGLRNTAMLWGRFDFSSDVTWVELQGTYQISRIGTGNQLSSQLQTESEIVRVESMSLRVWRARMESVVFGKDGIRQITALFANDVHAQSLAGHLAQFAQSQSVIASTQSTEDQRRMAMIGQSSQLLAASSGSAGASASMAFLQQPATNTSTNAIGSAHNGAVDDSMGPALHSTGTSPALFCSACGAKLAANARFCSACGTAQSSL